jgi:hypothetical protein
MTQCDIKILNINNRIVSASKNIEWHSDINEMVSNLV